MRRPISFNDNMVRLLLRGIKTQTRRPIRPQPKGWIPAMLDDGVTWALCLHGDQDYSEEVVCPFGKCGDHLWVQETWAYRNGRFIWRSNYEGNADNVRWQAPKAMPECAARLWYELIGVEIQRTDEIRCSEIRLEGVSCPEHDFDGGFCISECHYLREEWKKLWDSIYEKKGFGYNSKSLMWVLTLKRIRH